MSVMSRKQAIVPADIQRRARRIATQASKLADQARPMTEAVSARAMRGAGTAAGWARPHVLRARAWMAVRASRGGVVVQDTLAPRVSAMMAAAAKKLDPPKQSRRLPKVLAGMALLAAGAAAATAMAIRNRNTIRTMPPPPVPSRAPGAPAQSTTVNPSAESERSGREADVNGLSRTS